MLFGIDSFTASQALGIEKGSLSSRARENRSAGLSAKFGSGFFGINTGIFIVTIMTALESRWLETQLLELDTPGRPIRGQSLV